MITECQIWQSFLSSKCQIVFNRYNLSMHWVMMSGLFLGPRIMTCTISAQISSDYRHLQLPLLGSKSYVWLFKKCIPHHHHCFLEILLQWSHKWGSGQSLMVWLFVNPWLCWSFVLVCIHWSQSGRRAMIFQYTADLFSQCRIMVANNFSCAYVMFISLCDKEK